MTPYRYIAFEGIDGAGKTTLTRQVLTHLRSTGTWVYGMGAHAWFRVAATRVIVDLREERRTYPRDVTVAAYRSDREDYMRRIVEPMLSSAHVVSDRSVISDAAYLKVLYGAPGSETFDAYRAAELRAPDIIVYVDTPPDEAADRVIARGRPPQHYENRYTLRAIYEAYEDVLFARRPSWLPDPIRYRNASRPDIQNAAGEVIDRIAELMPLPA